MKNSLIDFQVIGDERGSLISIEAFRSIPFEIKRVYYIFNTKPGERRGFHAHKNLQQVLIAVRGSCKILLDDGDKKTIINLNDCSNGLLLKKMIWREMYDFSDDCVLLVLANDYYDESDYIRDYEEFQSLSQKRNETDA